MRTISTEVEGLLNAAGHSDQTLATLRVVLNDKDRRGLRWVHHFAQATLSASQPNQRTALTESLLEVVAAVNNNHRPRVRPRIDFLESPWILARQLYRPVARGHAPAKNLEPNSESDLSRLDPQPSTFWRRPAGIAKQDLFHGFGRNELSMLEDFTWTYMGPKDGFGLNPGMELVCGQHRIKVKFAEVSSEPFATRMFWALGYHVEPTDHARLLRIRYDRRLFQEFHARQDMKVRFRAFGLIPVWTLDLQERFDPFAFIVCAVLHDGARWSGRELKQHLFNDARGPHPETNAVNFRPEVETRVDYLVMVAANAQPKQAAVESIGPWDFRQRDHGGRRELRGAGLLAAWLGWFDTRFENTKLKVTRAGDAVKLSHYFSDLGAVLGETAGLLHWRGEQPNAFPWTFTRSLKWQGRGKMTVPFKIVGFHPIESTAAFADMTVDDARWMARLIGELSEQQILQGLIASGFDSAEVRLYTEKLISRRDRLIQDLGLAHEIRLLRPQGVDLELSYDPCIEGPVTVDVPGKGRVQAPVRGWRVYRGRLICTRREAPLR